MKPTEGVLYIGNGEISLWVSPGPVSFDAIPTYNRHGSLGYLIKTTQCCKYQASYLSCLHVEYGVQRV